MIKTEYLLIGAVVLGGLFLMSRNSAPATSGGTPGTGFNFATDGEGGYSFGVGLDGLVDSFIG